MDLYHTVANTRHVWLVILPDLVLHVIIYSHAMSKHLNVTITHTWIFRHFSRITYAVEYVFAAVQQTKYRQRTDLLGILLIPAKKRGSFRVLSVVTVTSNGKK